MLQGKHCAGVYARVSGLSPNVPRYGPLWSVHTALNTLQPE